MKSYKTFGEAFKDGYRITDCVYGVGYVSRINFNVYAVEIKIAGGKRKGQMYFEAPCYLSTRYCHRIYIGKEK